jgi:uncharacterized protein YfeS
MSYGVANEAIIAAAFAAVKFRGTCDARSKELAVLAIERDRALERRLLDKGRGRTGAMEKFGKLTMAIENVPE